MLSRHQCKNKSFIITVATSNFHDIALDILVLCKYENPCTNSELASSCMICKIFWEGMKEEMVETINLRTCLVIGATCYSCWTFMKTSPTPHLVCQLSMQWSVNLSSWSELSCWLQNLAGNHPWCPWQEGGWWGSDTHHTRLGIHLVTNRKDTGGPH